MSQDSSDEDSEEEEEDFARVQFGSRYTAAWRVCFVCACLLSNGPAACTSGPESLVTAVQG